jgi:hypothetical protein
MRIRVWASSAMVVVEQERKDHVVFRRHGRACEKVKERKPQIFICNSLPLSSDR